MKKTIIFMTVLTVTLFAFMACTNPAADDPPPTSGPTVRKSSERYIVTPVDNEGKNYEVEHTYTDGMYDYYFVYLGTVDGVPVSAQSTMQYNGTTPITLRYTSTTETETSITDQNEENVTLTAERAIDTENEFNISYMHESGVAFGVATTKGTIEAGYRLLINTHNSNSDSRSTTNTHTSFESWKQSNSEEISFTIGEHGEPAGHYRLALFSSSDVYATIIRDKSTGDYQFGYNNFARSNTFFTAIDYAEDINGFNQRGNDTKFVVDQEMMEMIDDLPISETLPDNTVVYNFSDRTAPEDLGPIVISPEKETVTFTGNPDVLFTMYISIAPRNKDLTLMFNNMRFRAPASTDGINDTAPSAEHNVNIMLTGTNEIRGGGGYFGSRDWSSVTDGYEGKSGINVGTNNLHVSGAGSLTVTGGRGGDGTHYKTKYTPFIANLLDAFDYWGDTSISMESYDGGKGGVGIVGNTLDFNDSSGPITVRGGDGGEAGFSFLVDDPLGSWQGKIGLFFWYGRNGNGGNGIAGTLSDGDRQAPIELSGGKAGNLNIDDVKGRVQYEQGTDGSVKIVDAPNEEYPRGNNNSYRLNAATAYTSGGQDGARGDE